MTTNMTPNTFMVAVGASAGGLQAIQELIEAISPDLQAPVVVAVHSMPTSKLLEVLQVRTERNVQALEDGEPLLPGVIYIVPAARHAFFRGNTVRLSETVEDSGFRPNIDALFMSMASEYGEKAIAVVLSGMLSDGMRGAQVIYDMGGQTIVQDPNEAQYNKMPRAVISADHPTAILTAEYLGKWLNEKVGT